mmetsp:Transcript_19855/g.29698  ORF Transcript_19855/g.29698 Transcript_19855/m.29698 type:complete len:298 (+) Transcript_19855:53-946(+)|eukprot:CAMPEP_0167752260 /NCGR_PEP_ID=MMETSP0110_2-20121227/7036_1 /TAXON_ID=629695 /ORGANISM="Gymnochlora sp., Strain CCMP2014" /LENGTH=297 /DNA_ID=CAMNT_0007637849 /DNA_START=57 /DNA_END=950 /DNA_ORIENTATION=+
MAAPPASSSSAVSLKDLDARLTYIEKELFCCGHFRSAEAECKGVLNDRLAQGDESLKTCTVCVCIQAMYEQKKPGKAVDEFVLEQYNTFTKTPYTVFNVWFQHKIFQGDLRIACKHGSEYLAANKEELDQKQYDDLVYHLVFRCLAKLGREKQALKFVKRNVYLSVEKKQSFVKELMKVVKASKKTKKEGVESSTETGAVSTTAPKSNSENIEDMKDNVGLNQESQPKGTLLSRILALLQRSSKRLREVAPLVLLLVFVGVLASVMRNALSGINLEKLRKEAQKFLRLFFALDPLAS